MRTKAFTEMAVFSFDSGGRRCISPILDKYISGFRGIKLILLIIFSKQRIKTNYHLNCDSFQIFPIPQKAKVKATSWKQKKKAFLFRTTRLNRVNFSMPKSKQETSSQMKKIKYLIIQSFGIGRFTLGRIQCKKVIISGNFRTKIFEPVFF